ncbi:hypothetical protein [Acuticoccus mangrovi]|uniref:Uncharacterized protein n=1 Tax=Acuticoccus mangrovi TaxID=2796142 RepID=A0A934IQ32_9HYPH|nr:hypothetical protein [Acuticoccus mangrovi]MBJ3777992.1 hypothetical protein [Acuticoccus mangrovi]
MSTKDTIEREARSAEAKMSEAAQTVRERAEAAASDAQRAAQSYAEEGKRTAAGHIADFANAVRRAGDELSTRDQTIAARLVGEAAEGLEQVAQSISDTSVDDMVGSVQRFARRNPGAFVVGSVLAGLAVGRFVKATSERSHGAEPTPQSAYGAPTSQPPRPVAPGRPAMK